MKHSQVSATAWRADLPNLHLSSSFLSDQKHTSPDSGTIWTRKGSKQSHIYTFIVKAFPLDKISGCN